MSVYPLPQNEIARLQALHDLSIARSDWCTELDGIVRLASEILDCPIALISLVEQDEQRFKAQVGLDAEITTRDFAFFAHTIAKNEPLIVSDARQDCRFSDNPLVMGQPDIAFYAGVPISIDGTHNLGTLCVIDTKPKEISDTQLSQLKRLATVAEGFISAFRDRHASELAQRAASEQQKQLTRSLKLLEQVKELSGVGGWELQLDPQILTWTEETKRIHEVSLDYEPQLDSAIDFYTPEAREVIYAHVSKAMEDGTPWDIELPLITAKERRIWVRAMGRPVYDGGKLVSLVGTFQDVTEARETRIRIQRSEAEARSRSSQLQVVIDSMDEGVSVFDAQGKLKTWNKRYIDIFRKPDGEVQLDVTLNELLEFEAARGDFTADIDAHVQELKTQLATGKPQTHIFRTQNGAIIQSTHSPIPGGGWVGTHSDATVRITAAEQDEYAARHDQLTGLGNRLEFKTRMATLANGEMSGQALVLLLVDLDRFKVINDNYGHQAGDDLLEEVAQRLRNCVGEGDFIARLGGDEFAILTKCAHRKARSRAVDLAKRINASVAHPFKVGFKDERIGASVGICVADGPKFVPDDLMSRADRALYKVKETCRGSYYFHDNALVAEELTNQRREAAVRSSVKNGLLDLAFQPIFDLRDRVFCGGEALIRWAGSVPTEFTPSDLIQVAENTGAIDEIGTWVLEESLRAAGDWTEGSTVAVNVSPSQLGKGTLFDIVGAALARHGLSGERLEFEITEKVLLQDKVAVIEELLSLQSLGVRIALDDFGTGFASLSYLQSFPFNKLKIDRSFVAESSLFAPSRAIRTSIINLTKDLGISCTAEGIETLEQLQDITAAGCDFAQGFFLAGPVSAAEFQRTETFQMRVA